LNNASLFFVITQSDSQLIETYFYTLRQAQLINQSLSHSEKPIKIMFKITKHLSTSKSKFTVNCNKF